MERYQQGNQKKIVSGDRKKVVKVEYVEDSDDLGIIKGKIVQDGVDLSDMEFTES